MSFMNTEKEILLNKDEIKTLEIQIKEDEALISKEGHNFTRILYEHNLLTKESTDFCEHISHSKKNFLEKNNNLLNNHKNENDQILRKNILVVKNIFDIDNENPLNENPTFIDKFLSRRSLWIRKNKTKLRFDIPYLTQEEAYKASSACYLDLKQIIDFAELHDFCEFEKVINLNSKKNTLYTTDCLIKCKNDRDIVIELDNNFNTFKKFNDLKDKKKEYLIDYLEGLKEQINRLSKLEFVKNKKNDISRISNIILYIPCELALKYIVEIDPEIIEYALKKNIELFFPTTFLAIAYSISISHSPKGITREFKAFEKIHKLFLENKKKGIESNKEKIDKLLKINFEYLKAPSYQIKVTLNHEENYVLEEIVNAKGSNKSSVLRQILMEYSGIYKERDALKISVDKLKLEMKLHEKLRDQDLKEIINKQDLIREKAISEFKRLMSEEIHHKDLITRDINERLKVTENELLRRTESYQSEISTLRDEIHRKDDLMNDAINSINESLAHKEKSLKEDVSKKVVQIINPKEISEFGKIMELINQNILLLCDTSSIANKDQQRFIDMVYGGVYGLKGKIKEVSNKVFLYIPKNFDLIDDSEN